MSQFNILDNINENSINSNPFSLNFQLVTLSESDHFKTFHTPLHHFKSPSKVNITLPSIKELNLHATNYLTEEPLSIYTRQNQLQLETYGNQQHNKVIKSITKRQRHTSYQNSKLEKLFEKEFFPTTKTRALIAQELNMDPRSVQIWFQNRRQSWRKKNNVQERTNTDIHEILNTNQSSFTTVTSPSTTIYNKELHANTNCSSNDVKTNLNCKV